MLGLDAQFNIISYAVISSKYEKSQNISLSFIPLIEHVLIAVDVDYIPSKQIHDLFKETYGYEIPPAILNHLLKVLKIQGKIEFLRGEYIQINKDAIQDYDNKYLLETSLKSLATNLDIFLKKQGVSIDKVKIVNDVLRFIIRNAIEFNAFLNYNSNLTIQKNDSDDIDNIIVSFLLEERRNNTKDYQFLKNIYFGVIIATLISSGDDNLVENEKFAVENVILDSNYIFRLLNLQTELECLAARDTYKALKEKGCSFCVSRETLKQIADTIHNAIDNYSVSANQVLRISGEERFAGLASAILRRNLTAADLQRIIAKLEKTLSDNYGVSVLDDSEFEGIIIEKDDNFCSLSSDKPQSSTAGIIHDLKLIYYVRQKRSSNVYCMQQAKWWVLTDDYKLTKWNAKNTGKGKVLECITESQLATIMWLNEPQALSYDSLFSTALALRNRTLFDNMEFERISIAIETQKEKYAEDPSALDKLALVFSQKLINLDDLAEDGENPDEIFVQSIEKAEEFSRENSKLIEQNKKLIEEAVNQQKVHSEESEIANKTIIEQKSLLSAETLEHIGTLKRLLEEKGNKRDDYLNQKSKYQTIYDRRCVTVKIIVAIVFGIFIFFGSMIIQQNFGDWYLNNQLFYTIISACITSIIAGIVHASWGSIYAKLFDVISTNILKCLSYLHLIKNIPLIISNIDSEIFKVNEDIDALLNQINAKSKLD